jgi:hypothetical protein
VGYELVEDQVRDECNASWRYPRLETVIPDFVHSLKAGNQ